MMVDLSWRMQPGRRTAPRPEIVYPAPVGIGLYPQQPQPFGCFDPANSVGFLSNFALHPGEQK